MLEFNNETIEMTAPSWPEIGQLRLILIVGYILLFAWLISLCAAANRPKFDERAWCEGWNMHTANEWAYSDEWGCVRLQSDLEND